MKTSSGADKSIHRTESNYNGEGVTVDVNNEEESSMAMTVDVSHGDQDPPEHNSRVLSDTPVKIGPYRAPNQDMSIVLPSESGELIK